MGKTPWKPTKEQVAAAANTTIPDILNKNVEVLFCGINPGLYTAAIGHHFGRPGNRFWKVLHLSGFTPEQLSPFEERQLLDNGIGITNVVSRASATAVEVNDDELRAGAKALEKKIQRYQPKVLAILGVQAYRKGFGRPKAIVGRQAETIAETVIWVLPNPSGLQAHYQLDDMVELFKELRHATALE